MSNINLNISTLANGGVQEKINRELEKVFENIQDPNTKANEKRKLTITLTFSPNENRDAIQTDVNIKPSFASQTDVITTVLVDKDWKTGTLFANELKSSVPGQTYFDDEGFLKTDIGEKVETLEQETVVDFKKRKMN